MNSQVQVLIRLRADKERRTPTHSLFVIDFKAEFFVHAEGVCFYFKVTSL